MRNFLLFIKCNLIHNMKQKFYLIILKANILNKYKNIAEYELKSHTELFPIMLRKSNAFGNIKS